MTEEQIKNLLDYIYSDEEDFSESLTDDEFYFINLLCSLSNKDLEKLGNI